VGHDDRFLKCHRSGTWYYRRQVPLDVKDLVGRSSLEVSLKTKLLDVARLRRDAMEEADTLFWASLLGGGAAAADPATARYRAAQKRALALGFVWKSSSDLLNHAPLDDLIARLDVLKGRPDLERKSDAEALLGTAPRPDVPVSKVLEIYLSEIAPDALKGKSPAQIAAYKKVKTRAVANFIKVVGDKPVDAVTRADALAFFDWWQTRVTGMTTGAGAEAGTGAGAGMGAGADAYAGMGTGAGTGTGEGASRAGAGHHIGRGTGSRTGSRTGGRSGRAAGGRHKGKRGAPSKPLSGNSANRDVGNMRRLFQAYYQRIGEEGRDNPFRNLSFRDPKALKQDVPPFPAHWIRDRLLAPGAFDGLNREAALLFLALIETGCRPSELCNITADQIHLDGAVPFIEIRFRADRAIKTDSSVRQIPLVGVSLAAFMKAPDGFPRYRDKETNFSAIGMRHLRRAGLLPSEHHRIYSLRHAFETRMKEAGLDYELRCLLMGHALSRPDYGDGGSLSWRQSQLKKIELPFSNALIDGLASRPRRRTKRKVRS
jgi:integrase